MFLHDDELILLTGHTLHGWQRKWLHARGWKFETAANGRPVVSRTYAEAKMSDIAPQSPVVLNLAATHKDGHYAAFRIAARFKTTGDCGAMSDIFASA